jgi:hypothetical protein
VLTVFENAGTITSRYLFHPCLDIFQTALPITYREVEAEEGTTIAVTNTGEARGDWSWCGKAAGGNRLTKQQPGYRSDRNRPSWTPFPSGSKIDRHVEANARSADCVQRTG